jgi:hypothetical protein
MLNRLQQRPRQNIPKDQVIRYLCKTRQGITLRTADTATHLNRRQQTRVSFGILSVRARHRSYLACRLDISGYLRLQAEAKTIPVICFNTRLSSTQEWAQAINTTMYMRRQAAAIRCGRRMKTVMSVHSSEKALKSRSDRSETPEP